MMKKVKVEFFDESIKSEASSPFVNVSCEQEGEEIWGQECFTMKDFHKARLQVEALGLPTAELDQKERNAQNVLGAG